MTSARFTLEGERPRRLVGDLALTADEGTRVTFSKPKHSDKQRNKLGAMCDDLAEQCTHAGLKLGKDDWRHMISAMVFNLRIVPSLDGNGIVTLAPSTAEMSSEEMNAMIEGAYYVGSTRDVEWSDPAVIRDNPRSNPAETRERMG